MKPAPHMSRASRGVSASHHGWPKGDALHMMQSIVAVGRFAGSEQEIEPRKRTGAPHSANTVILGPIHDDRHDPAQRRTTMTQIRMFEAVR
jgi:hypothetical protein